MHQSVNLSRASTADVIPMQPTPPPLPSVQRATIEIPAQSVEEFLTTAQLVLGKGISTRSIDVARHSDLDLSTGRGAISVRARLPNGLELEATRTLQRHSLRWRRVWPYAAATLALAAAVLLAWNGSELLGTLSDILREVTDIGHDDL